MYEVDRVRKAEELMRYSKSLVFDEFASIEDVRRMLHPYDEDGVRTDPDAFEELVEEIALAWRRDHAASSMYIANQTFASTKALVRFVLNYKREDNTF